MTVTKKAVPLWKFVLGGVLAVVFCASLYYWLRPSLAKTAQRGVDCVLAGDGACVYDLSSEEERLAYGMPREGYTRVLKEVVLPNLRSAGRKTEVQNTGNGMVLATHEALTPDGRRVSMGATATEVKEGYKSPVLIGMAVLAACMNENQGGSGGIAKLKSQRAFIIKNRAKLEEIGMKGIYRSPDEGLMTWDEWIERCDQGIARADATPLTK